MEALDCSSSGQMGESHGVRGMRGEAFTQGNSFSPEYHLQMLSIAERCSYVLRI